MPQDFVAGVNRAGEDAPPTDDNNAETTALPPDQIDVEEVRREAEAHVATLAAQSNNADMATLMQRISRMREEDRRKNTRKTYTKCWRLWEVSRILSHSSRSSRIAGR